jgi:glycerol uptake facilitator-like aquaporin
MRKKLLAEGLGTFFLLATVIGSGIMAERLSGGNQAVALLANTLATGSILVVIILAFSHLSGAHFNPVVSLVMLVQNRITAGETAAYIIIQVLAGIAGCFAAHAMFELDILQTSTHHRYGWGQWLAEAIATFGLIMTISGCQRFRADALPFAVGLYITAAYWFTASTSFANPAVTIARSLTNTFSGISPTDVPAFIAAQVIGGLSAHIIMSVLLSNKR